MLLDIFEMIANCYGGSNVLYMLILHLKCCINVPLSCVQPGTCRNIWNVPNLLLAGKWWVHSTRACNVLKMFSLVSRPPRPQCLSLVFFCVSVPSSRNMCGPPLSHRHHPKPPARHNPGPSWISKGKLEDIKFHHPGLGLTRQHSLPP